MTDQELQELVKRVDSLEKENQSLKLQNQYPMDSPQYGQYMKNLKEIKVGRAQMSVDNDGMYLGADKFSEAPFRVDYNGSMTATTGTFSGKIEIRDGSNNVVILIDPNG